MAVKEISCNTDLEEESVACLEGATWKELQWSDSTNWVGNPERKERKSEQLWAVLTIREIRVEYTNKRYEGFHWCVRMSVGHREERARRGTCGRDQPHHTGTSGHLGKVFTVCLWEC